MRVLIVVEGGVVSSVIADHEVEVILKDFDNIKDGARFDPSDRYPVEIVRWDAFDAAIAADVPAELPPDSHPGWERLEADLAE